MSDQRHPGGLTGKEAAKRLRKLGPIEDRSSRSVASIVAGNVFTFFNLIIGVFFVVMLALRLFADALFGFIAVINSYIGIRQEMKARETLESLALANRRGAELLERALDGEARRLLAAAGAAVHSSTPHPIPPIHRNASELAVTRSALLHSDVSPHVGGGNR